ncbi:MAG: ribosome assembly RNA-binding protein YhbY [Pseudomonadales bacterium]
MDNATRKRLRQIAHHLHPVVIVGDAGVSDALVAETDRALNDHELIKVKVNAEDREARQALGAALTDACRAEVVQRIGKVLVLYRHNPEARADLSNVLRAGGIGAPR